MEKNIQVIPYFNCKSIVYSNKEETYAFEKFEVDIDSIKVIQEKLNTKIMFNGVLTDFDDDRFYSKIENQFIGLIHIKTEEYNKAVDNFLKTGEDKFKINRDSLELTIIPKGQHIDSIDNLNELLKLCRTSPDYSPLYDAHESLYRWEKSTVKKLIKDYCDFMCIDIFEDDLNSISKNKLRKIKVVDEDKDFEFSEKFIEFDHHSGDILLNILRDNVKNKTSKDRTRLVQEFGLIFKTI